MKILYLGSSSSGSTSLHRARALERLGYGVEIIDPSYFTSLLPRAVQKLAYRDGYRFIQGWMKSKLESKVISLSDNNFNCIWIDSGEWLGASILNYLKRRFQAPLVLFNLDDPSGHRDGKRFSNLINGINLYKLCASPRVDCILELKCLGSSQVHFFWRGFDEVEHLRELKISREDSRDSISFVGTFIKNSNEKRDYFLKGLIDADLPLKFWGDRWQRSKLWPQLNTAYQGSSLSGDKYTQAISTGIATLGFLSHGNRDLHTHRSLEIPSAGGLLCAERTSEHMLLFEDGYEAVFWSTLDECIDVCRYLIDHPREADDIRKRGQQRAIQLGVNNEELCRNILDKVSIHVNAKTIVNHEFIDTYSLSS